LHEVAQRQIDGGRFTAGTRDLLGLSEQHWIHIQRDLHTVKVCIECHIVASRLPSCPGKIQEYEGFRLLELLELLGLLVLLCILILMRPFAEQTILITGATNGLGLALAQALAEKGATVLLHGRDNERGKIILDEIRQETGNQKLRFYCADLASLRQASELARRVAAEQQRLDILINNAGVGFGKDSSKRELSQDGYELRFAVNYLAPYVLTKGLLSNLKASAPARIVNVASVGQAPLNFEDIMSERGYSGVTAYRQSKLAMLAWSFDLAGQLANTGVTVNALHPASLMPTKMVLEAGWSIMSTVEEGMEATMRLVVDPALDGVTGKYFDGLKEAKANAQAYDMEARRQLAELTEELVAAAI
jgi:NAD(P)-dependent dehydrogenase (short-subunit alcohol dehydrogenase family)